MPRSANTGAYSIVQQNVSCFTRTCFFRSRPANRAEELGARAEELELRTHIFLQVKYGFPTGKIRVPKMKVLKRRRKYGFLRAKDGFPTDKIWVHCQNLPFSLKTSAMQLMDAVFSSKF